MPLMPVASARSAIMAPHTLGRPLICEAPKKTAAIAGKRYPGPMFGPYVPTFQEYTTPANPAITAETTSDCHTRRSVATPARRAAPGLPPAADMWRPTGVG